MADELTHVLKYPLEVKDKDKTVVLTVDKIVLRAGRIKAKDLRATDGQGGEVAKTLALIGVLSGQPPAVLDELDAEDFAALGELLDALGTSGPKTGQTA